MVSATATPLRRLADPLVLGDRLKRAGAAAAPFATVLYLAFKGGGYDTVVWGEIGIGAWWVLGLGAAVGALPVARLRTRAWVAIGLLGAFAVWTLLSLAWTGSAERTFTDLARITTYLSVLFLALAAVSADMRKQVVGGVAAAIAAVMVVAVLSRIQPDWFSANETNRFLPEARERLSYPLNYWNALGAFAAMAIPLLLAFASSARTTVVRSGAAALVSVAGLCAYLTLSRAAVVSVAVGLLLYFVLAGRRPLKLLSALPALTGAAILIAAAHQRTSVIDGATTPQAGDEMVTYLVVVAAGVAALHAAISLALVHGPPLRLPEPSRRTTAAISGAVAAVLVAVFLAAGGTGYLSDRFDEFKGSGGGGDAGAARLNSVSGNGRYQYWGSSIDAGNSKPLTGIGAGTFEFWWAEHGDLPGFVRDAHSQFFETYAELGLPGVLLLLALVAWLLLAGGGMALRSLGVDRTWAAAATAAVAAVIASAAVDWTWEVPVLPISALILAAAVLAGRRGERAPRPFGLPGRVLITGVALLAFVAVLVPLSFTGAVRDSQHDARGADLNAALDAATAARRMAPFAATPSLQEALVRESAGDLPGATGAAQSATRDEPTNWRTWLVLSRLEAKQGHAPASVAAYRRARALNPRSPLFRR